MNKIAIVGICGAGKSTLARELSTRLQLPLIHLDRHYWRPGWVQTPTDEWREIQANLLKDEKWIVDGNYSSSFDIRFLKADTIIVLDYSTFLAIRRAITRVIKGYFNKRSDIAEGCNEKLDLAFLKFIWNFNRDHKPRLEESLTLYAQNAKVIRFETPAQLCAYLNDETNLVEALNKR